jgi:hypothetical protein
MGLLNFFARLLGLGGRFNGTPEQYLAMAQYIAAKNNPNYTCQELLQWGETFQKIMNVKLSPYQNFQELTDKGVPDDSLIAKVDAKYHELHKRQEFKKAIYSENSNLGDDDIMTSQDEGAVFARKMIKDLSKHVEFPEEERRKLYEL